MVELWVVYILAIIIILLGVQFALYHYYFHVMHSELLSLVMEMEQHKYFEAPSYDGCMSYEIMNGDIERYISYKKQYETMGFDDSVVWSLDNSFGKWIVPRLERFIEISATILVKTKDEIAEYHEMLNGFKLLSSDEYFTGDEKYHQPIKRAFELLAKHYSKLWY